MNCTTKITSVTWVRPSRHRKVVRIATAAITNGTIASSEPNTRARMINAPVAPKMISASTPRSPPDDVDSSAETPVTTTGTPATVACAAAASAAGSEAT